MNGNRHNHNEIWQQVAGLNEPPAGYAPKAAWERLYERLHTRRRRPAWLPAAAAVTALMITGGAAWLLSSLNKKRLMAAGTAPVQAPALPAAQQKHETAAPYTPAAATGNTAIQHGPATPRPLKKAPSIQTAVTAPQLPVQNTIVIEKPQLQEAGAITASVPVLQTTPASRFRKAHLNELSETAVEYITAEQLKKAYSAIEAPLQQGNRHITTGQQQLPFIKRIKEK